MAFGFLKGRPEPCGSDADDASSGHTAIVLDVETTGLSPYREEIIELALILFRFDEEGRVVRGSVEEYVSLREPTVPISPMATRVHGLTMDDVAGHRLDGRKVRDMFGQADYCIAHNASFDRPFVERLLRVARHKPWLCTCRHVNWRARGVASGTLGDVTRHYGIRLDDAHRALADARATFELLSLRGSHGGTVLGELLERSVRTERRA